MASLPARCERVPFCALTPAEIEDGIGRLGETVRELRGAVALV